MLKKLKLDKNMSIHETFEFLSHLPKYGAEFYYQDDEGIWLIKYFEGLHLMDEDTKSNSGGVEDVFDRQE